MSQLRSNTAKTDYLSCDTEYPAAMSKGSNGRILQWTLIFPLSSQGQNTKMYLTQITGEDKYIRICEADMKVFKRAGGEKNSINVICLEKLGEST